ncbi:MAG: hypothetical protein HY319_12490 [Armatimonadetes bacterium]|nr:hypothetical protein [Armatimonadota bacterium]
MHVWCLLLFYMVGGIAFDSLLQDARRSRAAPVTFRLSELHGNHAFDRNAVVRIEGRYQPGLSFLVGKQHYFVLVDGNGTSEPR